jgi:hypothetical protein
MANTLGEKELKTDYPIITGLEPDDKHEGRQVNLVAEDISLPESEHWGSL